MISRDANAVHVHLAEPNLSMSMPLFGREPRPVRSLCMIVPFHTPVAIRKAIVSVTVQDASKGDTATLPYTLTATAEQVELVWPEGVGVEEVIADKGIYSDETLLALDVIGAHSYVSEPDRGRHWCQNKKTPAEKRAAQRALYGNRRGIRGARARRLQRWGGELVERPFANEYETWGLRLV